MLPLLNKVYYYYYYYYYYIIVIIITVLLSSGKLTDFQLELHVILIMLSKHKCTIVFQYFRCIFVVFSHSISIL